MNNPKMYILTSLLLIVCLSSYTRIEAQQMLISGHPDGPTVLPPNALKILVSEEILKELSQWDKRIWFFTSEADPIDSLKELNENDIAMQVPCISEEFRVNLAVK